MTVQKTLGIAKVGGDKNFRPMVVSAPTVVFYDSNLILAVLAPIVRFYSFEADQDLPVGLLW